MSEGNGKNPHVSCSMHYTIEPVNGLGQGKDTTAFVASTLAVHATADLRQTVVELEQAGWGIFFHDRDGIVLRDGQREVIYYTHAAARTPAANVLEARVSVSEPQGKLPQAFLHCAVMGVDQASTKHDCQQFLQTLKDYRKKSPHQVLEYKEVPTVYIPETPPLPVDQNVRA